MTRTFGFTLPADTNTRNLYTYLCTITGVNPNDGSFRERCTHLIIVPTSGNSGTITICDSNNANTGGIILAGTSAPIVIRTTGNDICLRDFYMKPSAASQGLQVMVTSF